MYKKVCFLVYHQSQVTVVYAFAMVDKSIFESFFCQVTEADIEEFEAKYRGSDSEKKDLKDLYTKYKGNMNR